MKKDYISVYKSAAPPFPTAVMASIWSVSLKDVIGIDVYYGDIYGVIDNQQCEWFISKSNILIVAKAVLKALSKRPGLVSVARQRFEKYAHQMLSLISREKLEPTVNRLSNQELLGLLKEGSKLYQKMVYWPEPANFSLEIIGQEIARKQFIDFMETNNPQIQGSRLNEIFSVLSNPTKRSFVTNAELSLLKIALIKNAKEKTKAIKNHVNKYYWQIYDYYGPILDENKIKEELKDYHQLSKTEIKKRIDQIKNYEENSQKTLARTLHEIKLPKNLRNIFQGLRDFAYFYGDLKKEIVSRANVGFGVIIKEMSQRFKIDETDLHFTSLKDLFAILKSKEFAVEVLKERRKNSILKVAKKSYRFLEKKEKIETLKILKKKNLQTKLIKGMSASSGLYVGKAKIIKEVKEIKNFKQGEVLVTMMTTVDFVPAMKKAGAIVTDLGAITSHAAIVSRELGIPCIVGTKNATLIIKDGDTVEVKANHGIVRLIKNG